MLSPADRRLAARDREIVGLPLVLDADALLAAIRRHWPDVQGELRSSYLRYKPGVSCLAGYWAKAAGQPTHLHARAYRPGVQGKLSLKKIGGETGGRPSLLLSDACVLVSLFPVDRRLRRLTRLADDDGRRRLLVRLFPHDRSICEGDVQALRYKPERRFVASLSSGGVPRAVLKWRLSAAFLAAKANSKALQSQGDLRLARLLAATSRYAVSAHEWLPGETLSDCLLKSDWPAENAGRIGAALAALHRQPTNRLVNVVAPQSLAAAAQTAAREIAVLCPDLAGSAEQATKRVSNLIADFSWRSMALHGDFHAGQVLWNDAFVGLIDLDDAAGGDCAIDLGNFLAHLDAGAARRELSADRAESVADALIEGYRRETGDVARRQIELAAATGLLRLASSSFRARREDWPEQIENSLRQVAKRLDRAEEKHRSKPASQRAMVCDPFGLADRAEMAFLSGALDPATVAAELGPMTAMLVDHRELVLESIRVVRCKPRRRCLIEYQWRTTEAQPQSLTTIAKVRVKGLDEAALSLQESLWRGGFNEACDDGACVPQPIGASPRWRMWLQRKAMGRSATQTLSQSGGVKTAPRIAEAIHKLHSRGPAPKRRHTMVDELRILRERLVLAAETLPRLASRLERVWHGCERLAESAPAPMERPIHRDWYADHFLDDGSRSWIIDLDLYCLGDPALDVGNFIAHVTEQSLRETGDAARLAECETAIAERYAELAERELGRELLPSIGVYTMLSLARLIQIGTTIADRRHTTEPLLDLCEERLKANRRENRRL